MSKPAQNSGVNAKVRGRPFVKGQVANPGGRPKVVREVQELARKHTVSAINALARIAKDPGAEHKDRIAAAHEILDRGFGRAAQSIALDASVTTRVTHDLGALSDDELGVMGHLLEKAKAK